MRTLYALSAATLLLCSCSREPADTPAPSDPVLSRLYRTESVSVIISASETNIASYGTIQLILDVHTPPGIPVVFPEMEPLVKPFLIADSFADPLQFLPNGRHHHRRTWVLAPALPGEMVLPPLEIRAGEITLTTDPVAVQVVSLLPADTESLHIRDIAEPVLFLPEERHRLKLLLYFTGIAGVMALLFLTAKMRRCKSAPPVLTPYEKACRILENLPEEEPTRLQQLTNILLLLLEGHFGVQTTGKTVSEIIPALSIGSLQKYAPELEQLLTDSEQFRFSNRIPSGFPARYEDYVRSFVNNIKEVPCD